MGTVSGAAAVFAIALAACSGSSADPMNESVDGGPVEVPPWACVPGETQTCDCPDELDGLRVCDAEGNAFGECDCSPGAVSQGPPPTSGGTETGSGSDTGSGTSMATSMGTGPATDDGGSTSTGPMATTDPDPTTMGGKSSSSDGGGGGSSSSGTG